MVYPALLPLIHTPRLPVVDWTDAPADLNGLVRFAERRNPVSARVPSHFKRSLLRIPQGRRVSVHKRGKCLPGTCNVRVILRYLELSSQWLGCYLFTLWDDFLWYSPRFWKKLLPLCSGCPLCILNTECSRSVVHLNFRYEILSLVQTHQPTNQTTNQLTN